MKVNGRKIKLTREEREIEAAAEKGWLQRVSPEEDVRLRKAFQEFQAQYRKDSVLNIRVRTWTLEKLKEQARKAGIKYQTFISGILDERAAHA